MLRTGAPYINGELELILRLVPTRVNIQNLSKLLERTEEAIGLVFKVAYERGKFGATAVCMKRKIALAKKRVGIAPL